MRRAFCGQIGKNFVRGRSVLWDPSSATARDARRNLSENIPTSTAESDGKTIRQWANTIIGAVELFRSPNFFLSNPMAL